MHIYLAARYSRYEEMQHVATTLIQQGHSITSRWIWGAYAGNDTTILDLEHRTLAQTVAAYDLEDLHAAECLIGFTEGPGVISRGGRHVEWGIAVSLGKRLILIGTPEHVFHCLPQVEVYACLDDICWTQKQHAIDRGYEALTGKEFQQIRQHVLQLSVRELAHLLRVKPQTIRNIESGNKQCGRQMSTVMRLRQEVALAPYAGESCIGR